ncbi:MAG: hypothetical protein UEL03_01520 [Clostridium sp.]|uniref:hypothetical protein n=1 Tax=Clostridium sp. TaxID=1506 RepID=UPI002E78DC39|nr:hypothetical protein [Clostridium sp.]MEE0130060.1 hypothetical protein [Clostridium sp.]
MNDNMNREKVISIRVTEDELKRLDELAKEQTGGNRTAFIIQKCFRSEGDVENISLILEFMICLKSQLICLKKGDVKKKKYISDLNERIRVLWQSLKS